MAIFGLRKEDLKSSQAIGGCIDVWLAPLSTSCRPSIPELFAPSAIVTVDWSNNTAQSHRTRVNYRAPSIQARVGSCKSVPHTFVAKSNNRTTIAMPPEQHASVPAPRRHPPSPHFAPPACALPLETSHVRLAHFTVTRLVTGPGQISIPGYWIILFLLLLA